MITVNVEIDEDRLYRELAYALGERLEKDMYAAVRAKVLVDLQRKTEEVLVDYKLPDGRSVRDVVRQLLLISGGKYGDRMAVIRSVELVVISEAERIIREEVAPYAAKVREEVKARIAGVIGL